MNNRSLRALEAFSNLIKDIMFWRVHLPVFWGGGGIISLYFSDESIHSRLRLKPINMSRITLFDPVSRFVRISVFQDLSKLASLGLAIKLFKWERSSEVIGNLEKQ
jgi:hypothetical protein